MIYTYYHYILECPDCGAPLQEDRNVTREEEYYVCNEKNNCDCHVFNKVLPWKLKFNSIETSYIEWVIKEKPRKFLAVTWPFRNPEIFSTVLAYEYFKSTGNAVMVVTPDGYTIAGTDIPPNKLPEFIYIEGPATKFIDTKIDKKIVFPAIKAFIYTVKGRSLQGKIHADSKKGFYKKIRNMYGTDSGVKLFDESGKPQKSRFGTLKSYNVPDFRSFYSHIEKKMANENIQENIIFHSYKNTDTLVNYINTFNPDLVIVIDSIYPFLDNNNDEFRNLRESCKDRTFLILGQFNVDELNDIAANIGYENIATINSYEFRNNIIDNTNLYSKSVNAKIPAIEIKNYENIPNISISNSDLQNKLIKILENAEITLKPLNAISVLGLGIDDIFDQLSSDYGDYNALKQLFPDTSLNPWASEIAEYIKTYALDREDNCIVASYDSVIPVIFNTCNIKKIKSVGLNTLSKTRHSTIIMTWLPRSFNPELISADRIVFFTTPFYHNYINNFFKYKKYLEYSNPFVFNNKNMPDIVEEAMHKIRDYDKLKANIDIEYNYSPRLLEDEYVPDNHNTGYSEKFNINSGETALFLYDNAGNYMVLPENIDIYAIKSGNLHELNTSSRNSIQALTGSSIPMDKSGFYAAMKARIIYFLLQNSERVRVNGLTFTEAYNVSRLWINELYTISQSKPDLAAEISEHLNITAKNEYYISTWWKIMESYKCVEIYRTERPKTVMDMIKIFNYIAEYKNDKKFDSELAIKCYSSCVGIQGVRNKLLNGKYPYLNESFRRLVSSIANSEGNFQVSRAEFQKIDRDINAMVIYNKK